MSPQAYKVVRNHYHEITGWTIISRLINLQAPQIVVNNGSIQSNLSTLEFKNGKKPEDFHSLILGLQQENILSGDTVSHTRLIFQ